MNEPSLDAAVTAAIKRVCNVGPYIHDIHKSTVHTTVYHCATCGAELRFGTTITIPTWAHYKPGYRRKS